MSGPSSILLIDDDDVNNYIVSRVFNKLGLSDKFSVIKSSQEALSIIRNNSDTAPDWILIDIHMPVMSGIEFLKELKKLPIDFSGTRFLPISSSIHPNDTEELEKLGLTEIMLKPVTIEKISNYLTAAKAD